MKFCYIKNRKCWICKTTKNRKEFSKDSHDKYGLQKACKTCQRKRNLKYYHKNREYFKKKNKEYYKKEDNPKRYKRYRKLYLKRRKEYSSSVIGRFNILLYSAKCRAVKGKMKYNLSLKWLLDQYKKQKKRCKITDIILEFKMNTKRKREFMPFSPSIHRKNPKIGYLKSNCVLVCTGVNIAMNKFRPKDFKKLIKGYLKIT